MKKRLSLVFLLVAALAYNRLTTISPMAPTVATVAGTGARAFSGDGGLAVDSPLVHPLAVAVGQHGEIYIAEGNRVREVQQDGRITTLAGTGDAGNGGDGGPAKQAQLNTPQGLAIDSAGTVYIADTLSNRTARSVLSLVLVKPAMQGTGSPRLLQSSICRPVSPSDLATRYSSQIPATM